MCDQSKLQLCMSRIETLLREIDTHKEQIKVFDDRTENMVGAMYNLKYIQSLINSYIPSITIPIQTEKYNPSELQQISD